MCVYTGKKIKMQMQTRGLLRFAISRKEIIEVLGAKWIRGDVAVMLSQSTEIINVFRGESL